MRRWTPHLLAALLMVATEAAWADNAGLMVQGRLLFKQSAAPACALCHTLKEAEAQGEVGPSLDELKPDAARVAKALRNGIGQMPSYRGKLTEQQIETLARYVAQASGASR